MTKQEFIALAKELLEEDNLDSRFEDLQLLRREFRYITNREEETFFDQDETNKVIAIYSELTKKEPRLLISPYEEKKRIIESAKKLLDKKEVIPANRELDKLSDDFKKAGRCSSKEQDDELWQEFRNVKD